MHSTICHTKSVFSKMDNTYDPSRDQRFRTRHHAQGTTRYIRGSEASADAAGKFYCHVTPRTPTVSSPVSALGLADKRIRMAMTTLCGKIPSHKITPQLLEAIVQSENKLRENRRLTQQRYRKKIDQRAESLEHDRQRLQAEIQRLELHYKCLVFGTSSQETPWSVVAEYYRLFRLGSKISKSPKQPKEGQVQMSFLHRVMAPDVSVNSGFGIDALVEEWRFIPQTTVQLLQLTYDGSTTMLASVKLLITFTEVLMRISFSHLVDTDNKLAPLAEKLLGKRLVVPVSVSFQWNATTAQIVSIRSTPDLLSPITKMLGNLSDAIRLLDNARLAVALGAAPV